MKGKRKRLKKRQKYYLAVGLAAVLIGGVVHLGTVLYARQPVQRLERPRTGDGEKEASLYVKAEDKRLPFTAHIGERKRTEAEIQELLTQAETELAKGLKGQNTGLDAVTMPLYMPATAVDGAVQVSWSSDRPEILSYDGSLGEKIPEEGVYVGLEAAMTCDDTVAYYTTGVFVRPQQDTSLTGQLTEAVKAANEEEATAWYILPDALGEQTLVWYRHVKDPALFAAGLVLALGFLLPQHRKEQEKKARQKYRDSLLQLYPVLVSQMVLYMGAGMSISQTFGRIAEGKKGRPPGVLEKACQSFVRELTQGIPEPEALHRFGERSGLWEYRTFCGLLVQNRARGNDHLLPML